MTIIIIIALVQFRGNQMVNGLKFRWNSITATSMKVKMNTVEKNKRVNFLNLFSPTFSSKFTLYFSQPFSLWLPLTWTKTVTLLLRMFCFFCARLATLLTSVIRLMLLVDCRNPLFHFPLVSPLSCLRFCSVRRRDCLSDELQCAEVRHVGGDSCSSGLEVRNRPYCGCSCGRRRFGSASLRLGCFTGIVGKEAVGVVAASSSGQKWFRQQRLGWWQRVYCADQRCQ